VQSGAAKAASPALPLLVSFIKQVMEKLNVKRSEAAGGKETLNSKSHTSTYNPEPSTLNPTP